MNTTYNLTSDVCLFHADMRDALRALPDNSIDSVVCDPPYHLTSIVKRFGSPDAAPAKSDGATGVYARSSAGFMGRTWDGGDIAFQVDTWREVLRVLKPGGFCAAFGAPRNFGRLQCAILDAGFDERDTILNMLDPADPVCQFIESLNESQLDAFMRCLGNNELASAGFLAWTFGVGFPKGRNVAKDIDALLLRGSARTEDVRRLAMGDDYEPSGRGRANYDHGGGSEMNGVVAPYEPATEQAKEWQNWNVALKPAFEPIVLARKPLSEGTVAANVLRWRTGALNIGACRIPGAKPEVSNIPFQKWREMEGRDDRQAPGQTYDAQQGRWPANVVTDGSAEVVEAFPYQKSGGNSIKRASAKGVGERSNSIGAESRPAGTRMVEHPDKEGSAARFFYSAKASKADRAGSKHPTVKPIDLIAYLQRLVTPPGGVTLDPFAGSGTAGVAAAREGFRCVLIEREAEYVEDIRRRFQSPNLAPDSAD